MNTHILAKVYKIIYNRGMIAGIKRTNNITIAFTAANVSTRSKKMLWPLIFYLKKYDLIARKFPNHETIKFWERGWKGENVKYTHFCWRWNKKWLLHSFWSNRRRAAWKLIPWHGLWYRHRPNTGGQRRVSLYSNQGRISHYLYCKGRISLYCKCERRLNFSWRKEWERITGLSRPTFQAGL